MSGIRIAGLILLGFLSQVGSFESSAVEQDHGMLVRQKMVKLFNKDEDTFSNIMYLLDKEDKEYGRNSLSPSWKTLVATLELDHLFKRYAEKILEENRKTVENARQPGGRHTLFLCASIGYQAWNNLNRWRNGEISGSRCLQNLMQHFMTTWANLPSGHTISSIFGVESGLMRGAHARRLTEEQPKKLLYCNAGKPRYYSQDYNGLIPIMDDLFGPGCGIFNAMLTLMATAAASLKDQKLLYPQISVRGIEI